jgi:release factor glutamine methyltransferase
MSRLIGALRRGVFRLHHRLVRRRLTTPDVCTVRGFNLIVEPGVLHPGLFASSGFTADELEKRDVRGRSVLDLGTGSGFLALCVARAGAGSVVALDVSPVATACASRNIVANRHHDTVSVFQSDVFDALRSETFDLIVSNPPFYPRAAREDADRRFAAGASLDFYRRLAIGLGSRLKPDGRLLLVHSSDTPWEPIAALLREQGFTALEAARRRTLFETLFAFDVERSTQRT